MIPPDLMDRLKKKGGLDKLRSSVRFSSLQYLTIRPVLRLGARASCPHAGETPAFPEETLTVQLDNYVLLSPEAINQEPLALIEYWAVDPNAVHLNPNNPLEKTASYRRRPVSRWLIIPRESGTTSRYCPLRGVFFLLDSGLRRNDELMDYLG